MVEDETVVLDREAMMLITNTSYIPKVSYLFVTNHYLTLEKRKNQKYP